MNALQHLLNTRNDIWRGHTRPAVPALPTGRTELDQYLPDHGWPCGQLIWLQPTQLGCGELSILLPALAKQSQQAKPILLISPPLIPYPQALIQAGVDLKYLWIIKDNNQTLWAAEQALNSGLCGAIVVWPRSRQLNSTSMRRLQLSCECGHAPCFVISSHLNASAWPGNGLRLTIAPGPTVTLKHPHHTHSAGSAPVYLKLTNLK